MEAENGGLRENLGCWGLRRCCTKLANALLKIHLVVCCQLHSNSLRTSQDAVEIQQDGARRWFTFSLGLDSVILLEDKGLPAHICGLACVGSPTLLPTVLHELEDVGEARLPVSNMYQINLVKPI